MSGKANLKKKFTPQRKRQSQAVHRTGTQRYQNQNSSYYKSPNEATRRKMKNVIHEVQSWT